MSTALQLRDGLTDEQVDLLTRTICVGATKDELALFVSTCNRMQLDPFARQVFAVKRWDARAGREVMSIQVSIDGFRLVAERTGKYAGQMGPFWTADGKEWLEVWLSKEPPAAAKVAVVRSDFQVPLWAVATWEQYKQEGKNGLSPMWRRMGPLMLAKCAESLALRRAFPNELSGVYTQEEMAQATPHEEAPKVDVKAELERVRAQLAAVPQGGTASQLDEAQVPTIIESDPVAEAEQMADDMLAGKGDTGEPASDEAKQAIRNEIKRLNLTPKYVRLWFTQRFGGDVGQAKNPIEALSMAQASSAHALLLAHGRAPYQAILDEMIASKEVLG